MLCLSLKTYNAPFLHFQGVCGLPENYDSQRAFAYKLEKLFQLIKQSEYTVVLTGAGISTSAGIPDFRGPFGIWTREQRERERNKTRSKKKQKKEDVNDAEQKFISFDTALPTFTHRALTHLIIQPPPPPDDSSSDTGDSSKDNYKSRTYIHHIVTQNFNGLHRKTNLPRNKMSILHGCSEVIRSQSILFCYSIKKLPFPSIRYLSLFQFLQKYATRATPNTFANMKSNQLG